MNKVILALALTMATSLGISKAHALDETLANTQLHFFAMDFNPRVLNMNDNSASQAWFTKQDDHKGYFFLKKAAYNRRLTLREREAALFLLFKGFPDRADTLLKQLDYDTFDENKPQMMNYVYRLHCHLKGIAPERP